MYIAPDLDIPAKSGDTYRVVQHLGTGGNAVTLLVLATSGDHAGVMFALKVFRNLSADDRRARFLDEVEFLSSCDHPSIMRVYDEGVVETEIDGATEQLPFVVAEYLPRTLRDLLRERSQSTVERLACTTQLLSALVFLDHLEPKVVHRDIKPENIFVKGRSCVLGDFGLFKKLDSNEESDKLVFKESTGPGMPFFYRTPDLISYANNEATLTTASDVFQLGLVVAELFTNRNPAKAPPSGDHYAPLEMEPLGKIPGALWKEINPLILAMLEPDPIQRRNALSLLPDWVAIFQTAVQRARALDHAF